MSDDHFDKMTDFLSQEAKRHVLDAIACEFHNQGYTLQGNTEHNDVAWLANRICQELEDRPIESCSEDRQRELLKVADVAKRSMAALADRMASRYIAISKSVRTIERIARRQSK